MDANPPRPYEPPPPPRPPPPLGPVSEALSTRILRPSKLNQDVRYHVPETAGKSLLGVVHRCDGLLSIFLIGISDESKASAAAGVAVFDNDLDERIALLVPVIHISESLRGNYERTRANKSCAKRKRTATYGFFHHAKLLELPPQGRFICVPRKATG